MAPVIRLFGGSGFSGDFHGELDIRLRAPHLSGLLRRPRIEGPFRITNGRIGKSSDTPLLVFDEFRTAHGLLLDSSLTTRDSRLQAYGGTITGQRLELGWRPQWSFTGRLAAREIDSEALLAGLLEHKVIGGRLSGEADVHLQGDRFAALFMRPHLTGSIRLQDGILYRTDLKKAGASLGRESTGQTRFHDLRARIRMDHGQILVEDLKLSAQTLQASGRLKLAADDRLSGELDVGLQPAGFLTSIPLTISGTRTAPSLRPSNAALLGGVAGSGLMGPGLGTVLGIKLGETMERLGRKLRSWQQQHPAKARPSLP